MRFWVVQFRRTRRARPEARLFHLSQWTTAVNYANSLSPLPPFSRKIPLYMKPIVFQASATNGREQ
jgi:hypothetical protein